jgi:hypothetical protein
MSLTKMQILAANDMKLKPVVVPEWPDEDGKPGTVYLRVMAVGERDAYEVNWKKSNGTPDDFRTTYLARVLCNERGERLFSDDEMHLLKTKSGRVCHRLWSEAMAHNSIDEEDIQAAAKN